MCKIKCDDIEWTYELFKTKGSLKVQFISPTRISCTTKTESAINKLEKNGSIEICNKLKSALESKYKSKLIDSFHTKFRIFFFIKFLEVDDFDTYLTKSEQISENFCNFTVTQEMADVLTAQYYQKESGDVCYGNHKKTVSEITKKLFAYDENGKRTYDKAYVFDMTNDNYRRAVKNEQNSITSLYEALKKQYLEECKNNSKFTWKQFKELSTQTKCDYCGISIEQINKLGANKKLHNKRSETRGYVLEIDRKSPNLEYTDDNCCMACYWCNNAKTDEFFPHEFKEIARGINAVWNARLKAITEDDAVFF